MTPLEHIFFEYIRSESLLINAPKCDSWWRILPHSLLDACTAKWYPNFSSKLSGSTSQWSPGHKKSSPRSPQVSSKSHQPMASPQGRKTKTQLQHHLQLHSICTICITSHHAPSQKIWSSPHFEWRCTTLFLAKFCLLQMARQLGIWEGLRRDGFRLTSAVWCVIVIKGTCIDTMNLLHRIFTHRRRHLPRSGLGFHASSAPRRHITLHV